MAANKGNLISMHYLWTHTWNWKLRIKKNEVKASKYFKLAADEGDADAMIRYAFIVGKLKDEIDAC